MEDDVPMRWVHHDEAVLITTARLSADEEYERRRRKYATMMAIRVLAVLAGALLYRVSFWISLTCVIAGAVLPWCAVLIANDNPPRSKRAPLGPVTGAPDHALPGRVDQTRTIEG